MKSIESTKNYYDGISKGYSELYHNEQKEKIKTIKNHIPLKGKLLDLGCGDGVLNSFLKSSILLYSFDLSEELLLLNPNKNNYKFQGSATNLPFKNEYFNTISSFTMLQDIENKIKVLKEIKRTLKKEGVLILSFLKQCQNKENIYSYLEKKFEIIEKKELNIDEIIICKKK